MELTDEQKRVVRAAARERKRKQRERDKQKRIRALEAQQAAAERAERRRRNLLCYGECTAGRDASTLMDEVTVHRQFLRALHEPDVRDGESLRSVAQRTYEAWITGPFASRGHDGTLYGPAFNNTTQQFDPDFGFVLDDIPFDELWAAPSGCTGDESINVDTLPELPKLPKAPPLEKEPVPEPKPLSPTPAPITPSQPNVATFTWIPHVATNYLNNGWHE